MRCWPAVIFACLLLAVAPPIGNGGSVNTAGNMGLGGGSGATSTPSASPAPVIDFYVYNCRTVGCVSTTGDPGNSGLAMTWGCQSQSGDTNNNAANLNCKHAFVYNEDALLACQPSQQGKAEQAYQNWNTAQSQASGYLFTQTATPGPSPSPLFVATGQGGCDSSGGTTSTGQVVATNPHDQAGTICIWQSMATATPCSNFSASGFVSPWADINNGVGISFDNQCYMNYCGPTSAQYGISFNYLAPTASNFGYTIPWAVEKAAFYDLFCQAGSPPCVPVTGKFDGGAFAHCCDTNTGAAGSNTLQPTAGNIHFCGGCTNGEAADAHTMCHALTKTNLKAFILENIVDRANGNIPDMFVWFDTIYNLLALDSGDSCGSPTFRIPIQETTPSYWTEMLAMTEMAGDCNTMHPIPWRTIVTADSTQVAAFVDYDFNVCGAVESGGNFNYGGTTTGTGQIPYCIATGAANGGSGNTGGVQNLMLPGSNACPVIAEPVLRREFNHTWVPSASGSGADDWGPVCVIVNTSSVSIPLAANVGTYCTATTYTSQLTIAQCNGSPCEGQYTPAGYTGPFLTGMNGWNNTCSNTTWCCGEGTNTACSAALNNSGAIQTNLAANSAVWLLTTAAPPPIYVYDGDQIYGNSPGQSDSITQKDISGSTLDTNSANIMANAGVTAGTLSNSSNASLERVNIASNATPVFPVGLNGGHNFTYCSAIAHTSISQGPENANNCSIPWVNGWFIEGTFTACPGNDGHFEVMNTDANLTFEGGKGCWNNGTTSFTSYNGGIHRTDLSFTTNYGGHGGSGAAYGDNWSVSGIPALSFTDFGEDLSLASINHPGDLILPQAALLQGTNGVNISPGVGNGNGSCVGAANCFELGDLLRLKSSVTCANADSQVTLVCNQWKKYGIYVTDTNTSGPPTVRFGLDLNGVDDSHAALWTWMHSLNFSTSFEVVQRGTTKP